MLVVCVNEVECVGVRVVVNEVLVEPVKLLDAVGVLVSLGVTDWEILVEDVLEVDELLVCVVLEVVVLETRVVTVTLLDILMEDDTDAVDVDVRVVLGDAELVDDNVVVLLCVVVLLWVVVDVPVLLEVIDPVPVLVIKEVLLCLTETESDGEEVDVLDVVILRDTEPLDVDVRVPLELAEYVPVELPDFEELIEDVPVLEDVLVLVDVGDPDDVLDSLVDSVSAGLLVDVFETTGERVGIKETIGVLDWKDETVGANDANELLVDVVVLVDVLDDVDDNVGKYGLYTNSRGFTRCSSPIPRATNPIMHK